MDTFQFLTKILPRQGLYVLASFPGDSPDLKHKPPNHIICDTVEILAATALREDARGRAVYHARSSFAERLPANGGMRSKENVSHVRSLAIDLDVGPGKPYAGKSEAAIALQFVNRQLKLPAPLLVSSGRGLHAYWVWDQDIPVARAQTLCDAFAQAARQHNLHVDPAITTNLAAVLRPIGTHWRKAGEQLVRLGKDAPETSFDAMLTTLGAFVRAAAPTFGLKDEEWGTGQKVYQPSTMTQIAKRCRVIKGGATGMPEPLWHKILGVARHCTDGAEWAHAWSGADAGRYDAVGTQRRLDGWLAGPTTCEVIRGHGGNCEGCEHTRIKSPIHLGYTETPVLVTTPAPIIPPAAESSIDFARRDDINSTAIWSKKHQWDGSELRALTRVVDESGAEGWGWEAFAHRLWYPYARTRLATGAMAVRICARGLRGNWDDFELPSSSVVDDRALQKTLGEHEIFLIGKKGAVMGAQYIKDMMSMIETHAIETQTIGAFGWHDDGFVVGNTQITADGERPVILSDRVPGDLAGSMKCRGTATEWARLVDQLYNRPGAEPYQFALCCALASPIVSLIESDLWHGIPIALVGESGVGKTTTCLVGASIFGNPKDFLLSAHEMGTTLNALLARVAVMRNLPIVLDELHGMKGADLPSLLYALSNGRPKNALRADRTFVNDGMNWNMMPFVTSNDDLIDKLSENDRAKSEATQVRIFQIKIPNGFNAAVFGDINAKDIIENQLLANQYGAVGRVYLRALCKHREKIAAALQRKRSAMGIGDTDSSKERFQLDARATALVAGAVAKSLGIIKWDLEKMDAWAASAMDEMRSVRASSAPDFLSDLQQVLSDLVIRTVQTKTFPKQPIAKGQAEHVEWRSHHAPIARQPLDSNVLIVTKPGLREMCRLRRIPPGPFIDSCEHAGLFLAPQWSGVRDPAGRIYPFRGTDLPNASAQIQCFIVDLGKLDTVAQTSDKKIVKLVKALGATP